MSAFIKGDIVVQKGPLENVGVLSGLNTQDHCYIWAGAQVLNILTCQGYSSTKKDCPTQNNSVAQLEKHVF